MLKQIPIKMYHISKIPVNRLFLRIMDILKRKIRYKKNIEAVQFYLCKNRVFKTQKLSDFIIKCRGSDTTGVETKEGIYKIRGFKRALGDLNEFDWNRLISSDEADVNWLYEFTYLSIFLKMEKYSDYDCQQLFIVLSKLEESSQRNYASKSLAWTVISVSNRLINLYSIAYNLEKNKNNNLLLERVKTHGEICRSYLHDFTEYFLHYNHLLFGLAAQMIWDSSDDSLGINLETNNFVRFLEEQINLDGFHAELSPTYHLHVVFLIKAVLFSGKLTTESESRINKILTKMQEAILCVLHPDGEIAIMNDSAIHDHPSPSNLFDFKLGNSPFIGLTDSGFYKIQNDCFTVIFNAGNLGPRDNPGHCHIDFLNIEASVFGKRLIVDPGVASYKKGKLRDHSRTSVSHNGVQATNEKLAELSGAFQVGRTATCKLIYKNIKYNHSVLVGETTLFQDKNKKLRRLISISEKGLVIVDFSINTELKKNEFILAKNWNVNSSHIFDDGCNLELVEFERSKINSTESFYYPFGPGKKIKSNAITIQPSGLMGKKYSVLAFSIMDKKISDKEIQNLIDLISVV